MARATKPNKKNTLKKPNTWRRSLIPFLIGFALIGGAFLAYRSFAAETDLTPQNVSYSPKGFPSAEITDPSINTGPSASAVGACTTNRYCYVGGSSRVAASGAQVSMSVHTPRLGSTDAHTLAELAVQSADGKQIVEIGWTVNHAKPTPHLFAYHWIDGKGTCYNGCGFVRTASFSAGSKINLGADKKPVLATFKINHVNGQWRLYYNGSQIGYYPDSRWGGRFKSSGLQQVFGEVAMSTSTVPRSQMGSGAIGTAPNSAYVSNFATLGTSNIPYLYTYVLANPKSYNMGSRLSNGFHYGGPGGY